MRKQIFHFSLFTFHFYLLSLQADKLKPKKIMKQKSFLLSLLTVLLHLTAWATSFTVDGIRYNTTSAWEVEVLAPSGGDRYQGAVNINTKYKLS